MTVSDIDSMHGKTCMVTGATGGLGMATVLGLALRGARVLMVARDHERGEAIAAGLRRRAPEGSIDVVPADLASQRDIRRLADQVIARQDRLDVLINNAAVVKARRELTTDRVELTLAINHLAPFLLTHLLLDLLRRSGPSRIVNIASLNHRRIRRIPWDDLQGDRGYSPGKQYALTKLMNVLFTYELAGRLAGTGVTANCLHPGLVRTGLTREVGGLRRLLFAPVTRVLGASPERGARTTLYLACSPEVATASGQYFSHGRPRTSSGTSYDQTAAQRLWEVSMELCRLAEAG